MGDYKTIDGLMRHLRENGIAINGSAEKRQLRNTGYYHGYKGYRFYQNSQTRIPFTSYKEVYATIQYDSKLKALLYDKIMFIETAVKNISIECILDKTKSESIQAMYDLAVENYNTYPELETKARSKIQNNKLGLQNTIQSGLSYAYQKQNPKITHFYNNMSYSGVPIWALFEILTMGDIGYLLSCLTYDVRDAITKELGLNASVDTNRELVYKYIFALKDLRNAVAHNAVVFDARFRKFKPSPAMEACLKADIPGLLYVNFKTIGDYIILVCYYLKRLGVSKTEMRAFVRSFEEIVAEYKRSVSDDVVRVVIHPNLTARMTILKNFI